MTNSRLQSVMHARDSEVLQALLNAYAQPDGHVVDLTANRRKMWRGVQWSGTVTFLDNDPDMSPDIVADFRQTPLASGDAAVVVFDPPHLPSAAASKASLVQMRECYGLAQAPRGDNVTVLLPDALREIHRLLCPDGVAFIKLKDYVHNHKYQWMLVELVVAIRAIEGLTACDLIVKRDPCGGNLKSGRWARAYHARNVHCWWVVVRKGSCEPKRKP